MKKKIACTECDYSTHYISHFKSHCVTHTGVKAHKCDICGNCFTKNNSLTTNIKSVPTKESEYDCEVCEKMFTQLGNLFRHVKLFMVRLNRIFVLNVRKLSLIKVNTKLT